MTLVQTEPKNIKIWTTDVKRVMLGSTQVRPKLPKWNGDLTKATLSSTTSISGFLVYGVTLSDDWTKLYYQTNNWNRTQATFHQFTLTTPFDISTRTNEVTFNFGSSSAQRGVYPWNILFRNWGSYMYIAYHNSVAPMYMERYTLSTPRDISTKTLTNQIIQTWGDGCNLYVSEDGLREIYSNTLGVYYKTLTNAYELELWTMIESGFGVGFMWMSPDGLYLYWDDGNVVKQYQLSTPRDVTTRIQIATLNKPSANYNYGLSFNADGSKLRTVRWWVNSCKLYCYDIS